ncbi:MAG TPA: aminotransferase class I/II-fold pyridoxal phosphate-dependent enzyme [Polyangiaceae bacterium]|nr:aminotransferase class I/II-fold pyridoxal phosphate-dependent enzyme [Polyangiaceae bacterium]
MTRVYLSPPHMGGEELRLVEEAFETNWIAPLGPHVDAFEQEMALKIGVPHACALSSGTAGLHLALLMLGIGRDDEVVTSTLTFSATANAITYVGAQPVFVDCHASTWNMDPELLAEYLERRAGQGKLPKAVAVVDLYGQCADYGPLQATCARYAIPLLEDAAESLGATYQGRSAGSFGEMAVFSFNGNKMITTAGGGMLVSHNKTYTDRARFLATQARDPAPHYQHSTIGYNYRLSNVLAAIGRGQLRVLDERVAARRANFSFYQSALGDLPGLTFMPEAPYGMSTRWLTCILIDPAAFGASREDIRLALEKQDIESRPVWKPMHLQPVFQGCATVGGDVAASLFESGLCLTSGSSLSLSDKQRVVSIIHEVHDAARRG